LCKIINKPSEETQFVKNKNEFIITNYQGKNITKGNYEIVEASKKCVQGWLESGGKYNTNTNQQQP